MDPVSPLEPFPLSPPATGKSLSQAHLNYLKSTVTTLAASTQEGLIKALKDSSGTNMIEMTDDQWQQLAGTALTIGSSGLDKIAKKLSIQAAMYGWAKDYDYRPIATQIHAIATPARKIINGLNFRGKCVRAVLKVQSSDTKNEEILELQQRSISSLQEVIKWQGDNYDAFEKDKAVDKRFHPNYKKEWVDFCGEWNASKIDMSYFSGKSLESIYFTYLKKLNEESNKSKIQWEPVLNLSGKVIRPDAVLRSGFLMNFKRKPEKLSFLIDIPNLDYTEFNAISLDLMDLIEQVTGIKHVETGRDMHKSPNVLQVDLLGEFTMAQSKVALGEIDSYLMKRFPKGQ